MTEVAIVAEAPEGPTPLAGLAVDDPAALYRAMLADVLNTCERSGATVLVTVGPPESPTAMAAMQELIAEEALAPDAVRVEAQVGADHGERVHNIVEHLLATSDHRSVSVVFPETPLLRRSVIDAAAMRMRSADVVIAPDTTGGVSNLGLTAALPLQSLTRTTPAHAVVELAAAADQTVAFLEMTPRVRTDAALQVTVELLRARAAAGTELPRRTARLLGVGTQQS